MNYCCCTPQIHCRYCQKSGKEFRNIKPFFKLNDKDNETFMNKHTHPPVPTAQPEPEQDPVAYGMRDTMIGCGGRMMYVRLDKGQDGCTVPLYTTTPQRKPLPLKEVERVLYVNTKLNPNLRDDQELIGYIVNAVRAIEAAHGIKE